jgi:hypothetical protein
MDQQPYIPAKTFTPTENDVQHLLSWFEEYQKNVLKNDLDSMAEMAIFPLIVMTDDSEGNAITQEWDRQAFKQALDLEAQGVDPATIAITNKRTPFFLNENVAIVITDAITTVAGESQPSRYADIMFKKDGEWKYKSMIQSGWGDMLKTYFGA